MLAIFGLALFQHGLFGWMSFTAEGGAVFGRSFLTAGAMMSLIALPMVFGATREGLQSIPRHVREASYGLGKTKIATIRRVLLPAVRPNISTGAALGMGRIAGDTAIVVILLGATLRLESEGSIPGADVLKGTGSTLTSYVYNNSPAGEGNAPEKAYAAAFVLLLLVVALNFAVDLIARRGRQDGARGHPPGSRTMITDQETKDVSSSDRQPARPGRRPAAADPQDHAGRAADGRARRGTPARRPRRHQRRGAPRARRGRPGAHGAARAVGVLRRQRGRQAGLAVDPPRRGARADRAVGLRQDDAAAHAEPPHRADARRVARRHDPARRRPTSTTSRSPRCAAACRWSSSSPTRSRCRSSTTSPTRCASSRASARGDRVVEPLVEDALRRAGLWDEVADKLDEPALRLSGGQQQRLCIARAIATRPEVLLMDEPCSALDPRSTAVIEQLIGELRTDLAIVIVTHNMQQARRVGDKVAFMYLGDLVEYGPAEQIFDAPQAQRTRDYVRGAFG